MRIDILDERERYDKKWNPDEEPDESQEVLRYEQYDECDEYRDMHIRGDYSRIEVVRLDRMHESYHSDHECYRYSSSVSIGDDEDRDS